MEPAQTPPRIEVDVPHGDGPSEAPPTSWPGLSDTERRIAAQSAFWTSAATLHRRRWLIVGTTALTALVATVLTLMMPPWYQATTRVMPPEGGASGGLSSLIGDLSPVASSLLGGGGGDYSRYLAILNSRSLQEAVVERFDLVRLYEMEAKPNPRELTIGRLRKNTVIEVDMETDALTVSVLDQDPERAAQMANFFVEELNRRNEALALEGAGRFRQYIETRYREIEFAMDSAQTAMTVFQQRNGIVEIPTMVEGMISAAAEQQGTIARLEVQYEALMSELGPENPQVVAARRGLETARRSQSDLLGGREAVMPVAMAQLPTLAGQYARLYQELVIQKTLMEEARPLLEQARFDEERERVAVQVLDPAITPERKAKPRRALLVLGAAASALSVSMLLVLVFEAFRRRRHAFASALAAARRQGG